MAALMRVAGFLVHVAVPAACALCMVYLVAGGAFHG